MLLEVQKDQTVTLTLTLKDEDGALLDPSEITAKVKAPGGNVTTYLLSASQITRTSLGVYKLKVTLNASGRWYVNVKADSLGTSAVAEDSFAVAASHV